MAVPASTTTTAQENGELGSRDDHAIELAGVASCGERAEHAIEIGDPAAPMAAAKELPTELDAGWVATVASMNRRLQEQSTPPASSEPPTIFRVPRNIRDVRPSAYEPRIISFGPYHRGREHLRPMEEHKWRYLRRFLSRQNGSRVLADYMRKMSKLEARARRCYADAADEMDANQFAEMMTLDGCFLVEFMLKMEDMQQGEQLPAGGAEDDDIVFNSTWGYALLMGDMLLLENQLPFFVLLEIWTLFFGPDGCTSKLVWDFLCLFNDLSPTNSTYPDPKSPHTLSLLQHHHHHLLHLFHSHVLPMAGSQLQGETGEPSSVDDDDDDDDDDHDTDQRQHLPRREIIPSATQLTVAGVEFKRKEGSTVLEATFSSYSGEMWISPLRVFDHTEACVRNLIAFEQCFPRAGNGVSSYAMLVGCLVDTPADVALLKRSGMLVNGLSSDEEAARVINNLWKDAAYSYHKGKLYEDVNRYRQKKWRRWRAELVHTYFSNPWSSWWWLPPYSCC